MFNCKLVYKRRPAVHPVYVFLISLWSQFLVSRVIEFMPFRGMFLFFSFVRHMTIQRVCSEPQFFSQPCASLIVSSFKTKMAKILHLKLESGPSLTNNDNSAVI